MGYFEQLQSIGDMGGTIDFDRKQCREHCSAFFYT